MSSVFCPLLVDPGPSGFRATSSSLSPSGGHAEDSGLSQHPRSGSVPLLIYPPDVDPSGPVGLHKGSLGGLGQYKGPLGGLGQYEGRLGGPNLSPGLLPYLRPWRLCECPFEPAFIQKRNERERQRVKCVNRGYTHLREHLPPHGATKRLSKVQTLRAAIRYIKYLESLMELQEEEAEEQGGEGRGGEGRWRGAGRRGHKDT